jgi:hypothetical protein
VNRQRPRLPEVGDRAQVRPCVKGCTYQGHDFSGLVGVVYSVAILDPNRVAVIVEFEPGDRIMFALSSVSIIRSIGAAS